jgi:hypothetical protein
MPIYDFSSGLGLLNQGINTLGSALGNRADAQAYAQIGDALANNDYKTATAKAWQMGKPDLAMNLQKYSLMQGAAGSAAIPPEGGGSGAAAAPAADGSTTAPDGTKAASLSPPAPVGKGAGKGYEASGYSKADVVGMIREEATARGIDPDVAVKVAQSEGLNQYVGDQGRSFGPFQLFTGGGLGNIAQKAGIDITDPRTVRQQIQFALDHAATNGWGSWYGARNTGIANNAGLAGAKPLGVGRAGVAGGPGAAGPTSVISGAPGGPVGPTLPAPGSLTPDATAAAQPTTPTQGSLGASMLSATKLLQSGQVTLAQLQQDFGKYGLPDPKNPQSQPVWDNLSKAAGPGRQVGQLNPSLPVVNPQGGAVPAALPPSAGPAPGTPGPGKPGELGTPVPAPPPASGGAAQMPLVPETPFPGATQAIPGLIPEQGGFGDQPPRPAAPPPQQGFTDPLSGLPMPQPPTRPTAPTPPVPGGPPGYSAARTGAGAATEADPRAVAGVAKDVPAVHTPAAVPASLQPHSGSGVTNVQGPAGPAPRRPSPAEQKRFLGPAASDAAADFGVAPSAIRAAPQAPAPMPPSTAATRAPFPAAPGGPGAAPGGPGAPGPPGGGNPIMALLQGLGIAPGPQGGAQPAALPPGAPPPGAQAPGAAPQAGGGGGGGPGILGGLLNMLSMQPPGGVPGLQSPASSLGYGAPRPMPGQPGFPGGAPPPLAGGAPGPVMAGGPGAPGAPAAAPAPAAVQQFVQTVGNAPANATLDNLKQRSALLHNRASQVSLYAPEMAKPIEDAANNVDSRIAEMEKQTGEAGLKTSEIQQTSQKDQANALSGKFADMHAKLTGASGVQASLENINAMEGNLAEAARGMGSAQELGETIAGLLAPFDPHFAGLAAGSQEFQRRGTQEMIQMATQLFAEGKLQRNEFNAIRDGTFTLGDRPDVVYDMLELSRRRALLLADNHNDQLQKFKKNYGPYGGNAVADQFQVDVPKELQTPGDRAKITGTGSSADKPVTVQNPADVPKLPPNTHWRSADGTHEGTTPPAAGATQ